MSPRPLPAPPDLEDVRRSYDRVAENYVEMSVGDVSAHPWLRGMLDGFAVAVGRLNRPVLDVGCGPGHVAAYLAGRGIEVSGVDLSPRMIHHARRLHPQLHFEVRSVTELDVSDRSLAGILGWWSLFNLPRDLLPAVFDTYFRALLPGGLTMIGTHVGDGDVVRTEAYGNVPVAWTIHLWPPEQLAVLLMDAGFEPVAELRLPPTDRLRAGVVMVARRPG